MIKYCFFIILFAPSLSLALEIGPAVIHGFASQRYVKTTGNKFLDDHSVHGSFDGTIFGITGFIPLYKSAYLSSLLLARNLGDSIEHSPSIDQLFLGMNIFANHRISIDARIGRFPMPFGIMGDVEKAPSAKASVILPYGQYEEYRKEIATDNTKSAELSLASRASIGEFKLTLTMGKDRFREESERNFIEALSTNAKMTNFGPDLRTQWRITYLSPGQTFFLRYARWDITNFSEGSDTTINGYISNQSRFYAHQLGIQWDIDDFTLTTELYQPEFEGHFFSSINGVPYIVLDSVIIPRNFYFELEQFFHSQSIYFRYEEGYLNKNDQKGNLILAPNPKHTAFTKSYTLGHKFNATSQIAFKTQVAYLDGSAYVSQLDAPQLNTGDIDRYWSLLAFEVTYSF